MFSVSIIMIPLRLCWEKPASPLHEGRFRALRRAQSACEKHCESNYATMHLRQQTAMLPGFTWYKGDKNRTETCSLVWGTPNELFEWDGNELVLHPNGFLLRNSNVTYVQQPVVTRQTSEELTLPEF